MHPCYRPSSRKADSNPSNIRSFLEAYVYGTYFQCIDIVEFAPMCILASCQLPFSCSIVRKSGF